MVGDFSHWALQSNSTVPCIGASGGISAVIMFYALQFPHARLGFLFFYYFRFHWFYVPAWCALVVWLLLQGFGLFQQMTGQTEVAATAHLGGAAVGFALWWWWKKSETTPRET
jgi:membrane associated rhomboid family serine protease